MNNKVTWKSLSKILNFLKVEHVGDLREITSSRMTRVGLELSGFIFRKHSSACILLGKEEYLYLSKFSKKEIDEKIEAIFKLEPPLVVISRSFPLEFILPLAQKYKITVFSSNLSSSEINTSINLHLLKLLSKTAILQGNLIEVFGMGVLIIGESGIGKSEITLELIKKGHIFVADDAVEYYRVFDKIIGKSPKSVKNLMEIRGIGIIEIPKVYGVQQIKHESSIDVIIELSLFCKEKIYERLGTSIVHKNVFGIDIPYYCVPLSPGKNIANVIEIIVNRQKLADNSYEVENE